MKKGLLGETLSALPPRKRTKEARLTCCTLDWIFLASRLDVCLFSDEGELVDELAALPDAGGL